MNGPGYHKKLSLRNLNDIQINEPIDKNSEESNDLIHIINKYFKRKHNSSEDNKREIKSSMEEIEIY